MTLHSTLNDEQLRALGAALARRRVLADVEMMRRRAPAPAPTPELVDDAPELRPVLIDPMGPARGPVAGFILGGFTMAIVGFLAWLIIHTARS